MLAVSQYFKTNKTRLTLHIISRLFSAAAARSAFHTTLCTLSSPKHMSTWKKNKTGKNIIHHHHIHSASGMKRVLKKCTSFIKSSNNRKTLWKKTYSRKKVVIGILPFFYTRELFHSLYILSYLTYIHNHCNTGILW